MSIYNTMILFFFIYLKKKKRASIGTGFLCSIWHYSIYLSIIYVISIFSIQKIMESKERFDLRFPLFCWNLLLCVFSTVGVYMSASVHFKHFFNNGIEASICDTHIQHGATGVWSFLFIISKAPELIDTFFIVLRKQKLIFLHWYHHVTVLIYCWYNYCLLIRTGQWFIAMNYVVHAIMYGYYALRISRLVKLPIWVNMVITLLQLAQMVVGVLINIYVCLRVQTDWECDGRVEKTYFYVCMSFIMYFSYFVLFAHFFYSAYFKKPESKRTRKTSGAETKLDKKNYMSNGHTTPQLATELRHR